MMLSKGSRGPEVLALTEGLNELGDIPKTSSVFDSVVEGAVKLFQIDEELAVDGIAGPATLSRLETKVGQRIKLLVVHHAATPRTTTVEQIRDYHVNHNGWRDIAYHYLLRQPTDESPVQIAPGRYQDGDAYIESGEEGAHVYGYVNYYSLGICCIGNFDEEDVPARMWDTLVALLTSFLTALDLSADSILGHKEVADQNTACPGSRFDLDRLRSDVLQAMTGGPVS